MSSCDPDQGQCCLDAAPAAAGPAPASSGREVVYVGDPMCSWCWGASPGLKALEAEAGRRGLPFTVRVGGLRAGGGDAWTPRFRAFLRHHWEEVGARTGQPFSFALLERPAYDYDTEPACRAVVVARELLPAAEVYPFFAALQERFYVHAEDPQDVATYRGLCGRFGVDFEAFRAGFESPRAAQRTAEELRTVRAWGVSSFPTVLFRDGARLRPLALGYAPADALLAALDQAAALA